MTSRRLAAAALPLAAVLAVATAGGAAAAPPDRVARGRYLVTIGSCNDCHTPLKMGPNGPAPDMTRMLSGHPQDLQMPASPPPSGPWVVAAAGTLTAWSGPWGVSFARNLTPDPETGIGKWTEREFIETLRTGRHLGRGRELLPPMPWQNTAQMTDADLKAVFAYLRTIPAVKNAVPDPIPPAAATAER